MGFIRVVNAMNKDDFILLRVIRRRPATRTILILIGRLINGPDAAGFYMDFLDARIAAHCRFGGSCIIDQPLIIRRERSIWTEVMILLVESQLSNPIERHGFVVSLRGKR